MQVSVRHVRVAIVVVLLCLFASVCHRCVFAGQADDENAPGSEAGEVLYNGIVLPASWPPRMDQLPRDPVEPAYLKSPPKVIPIDVGRQLFVDDFLIEETTLKRTYHQATFLQSVSQAMDLRRPRRRQRIWQNPSLLGGRRLSQGCELEIGRTGVVGGCRQRGSETGRPENTATTL